MPVSIVFAKFTCNLTVVKLWFNTQKEMLTLILKQEENVKLTCWFQSWRKKAKFMYKPSTQGNMWIILDLDNTLPRPSTFSQFKRGLDCWGDNESQKKSKITKVAKELSAQLLQSVVPAQHQRCTWPKRFVAGVIIYKIITRDVSIYTLILCRIWAS